MSKSKFDQFLDVLNTHAKALERITRRKKKWSRETLHTALTVGSAVAAGVAVAVPQARPVAVALEGLQRATPNGGQSPELQEPSS